MYRGVHTGFGEPIAIKCLKLPSELGEEEQEELLTQLQDEGRVLHRLSRASSGIVQALDVGAVTTPSGAWVPYLVLEWLDGETLKEHMVRRLKEGEGPYSLDEALQLLEPAARALEVAHRQKVAHRDVKPENIILTKVSGRRTLKVLDFGIAKVLTQHAQFTAAPAATQKSATAFTPSYGAPEQFNKKRGATGPWTDVFALGLILVELVSGERAAGGRRRHPALHRGGRSGVAPHPALPRHRDQRSRRKCALSGAGDRPERPLPGRGRLLGGVAQRRRPRSAERESDQHRRHRRLHQRAGARRDRRHAHAGGSTGPPRALRVTCCRRPNAKAPPIHRPSARCSRATTASAKRCPSRCGRASRPRPT